MQKSIPNKRYFSIREVSELCDVKPHVLRYWEQVFYILRPKKRGNRRYYLYEEVQLVQTIRTLLYDQLFTIKGAKAILENSKRGASATKNDIFSPNEIPNNETTPVDHESSKSNVSNTSLGVVSSSLQNTIQPIPHSEPASSSSDLPMSSETNINLKWLRQEVLTIMMMLQPDDLIKHDELT